MHSVDFFFFFFLYGHSVLNFFLVWPFSSKFFFETLTTFSFYKGLNLPMNWV